MAARSAPPAGLSVERNVDLAGTARGVLARRVLFAVLALVPAAALVGVFGQRPTTSTAGAGAAVLSVYSPVRLRGGLLFTTRFEVHANRALEDAALVLDRGWFEGMQVNSMTPTPRSERSTNDEVRLELGRVSPNDDVLLFIQFQVNPTTVGRRSQGVRLVDGSTPLVDLHRTVLVFP